MFVLSTWCLALTAEASGWPDLASIPPGAATADGSKDAALVVAIEDYAFTHDLPGAVSNGRAWATWLQSARGVRPDAIKVLTNDQATREQILQDAAAVAARAQPGGRVWMVFIGHGAPSETGRDGLLVGMDAQQNATSIRARGIGTEELLAALKGQQDDTLVILDACFSGASAQGDLAPGLAPMVPTWAFNTGTTTVLTAAREDEYAGPLAGEARPAFSYLLLGAMRGWGDRDQNGVVTTTEAVAWTNDALFATVTGRRQTPSAHGPERPLSTSLGERAPDLQTVTTSAPPPALAASKDRSYDLLAIEGYLLRRRSGAEGTSENVYRFGEGAVPTGGVAVTGGVYFWGPRGMSFLNLATSQLLPLSTKGSPTEARNVGEALVYWNDDLVAAWSHTQGAEIGRWPGATVLDILPGKGLVLLTDAEATRLLHVAQDGVKEHARLPSSAACHVGAIAPTGDRILLAQGCDGDEQSAVIYGLDGAVTSRTPTPERWIHAAHWSVDGVPSLALYLGGDEVERYQIVAGKLTSAPPNRTPAPWTHPSGVETRMIQGSLEVFVDGKQISDFRRTPSTSIACQPAPFAAARWLPDQRHLIALAAAEECTGMGEDRLANAGLYILDAEQGASAQVVVSSLQVNPHVDAEALWSQIGVWSPDGRQLVAGDGARWIRPDGKVERLLTTDMPASFRAWIPAER